MNAARSFAGVIVLAILTVGASSEARAGSGGASLVQVARVLVPDGLKPGLLSRAKLAEPLPLAPRPVDEARREAASVSFEEFSGGPAGTLLIAASLIAAVALILAVVFSR